MKRYDVADASTRKFYGRFCDHKGTLRRIPLTEDYEASKKAGEIIHRAVQFRKAGRGTPDEILTEVEGMGGQIQERLYRWGIVRRRHNPDFARMGKLKKRRDDFKRLQTYARAYACRATGIGFLDTGFKKNCMIEIGADPIADNFVEAITKFKFVPDGHEIIENENGKFLHILEIEDSCFMNPEKIFAYCRLNELAKSCGWNLRLHLTDRYGRGSDLNLAMMSLAFADCGSNPADHAVLAIQAVSLAAGHI